MVPFGLNSGPTYCWTKFELLQSGSSCSHTSHRVPVSHTGLWVLLTIKFPIQFRSFLLFNQQRSTIKFGKDLKLSTGLLESILKHRLLGSPVSDAVGLEWSLRIYLANKFQSDADSVVWGPWIYIIRSALITHCWYWYLHWVCISCLPDETVNNPKAVMG